MMLAQDGPGENRIREHMKDHPDPTDPERLFSYHKPDEKTQQAIEYLRGYFRLVGNDIYQMVEPGPERTLAMRALHQAQHHAVFALVAPLK